VDLLDQLRTLVMVVDGGSLSSAARARGLSVAAVSRQVRALEEELGASLLVRSTRALTLTEAGAALHERARRILDEVEQARGAVKATRAVRGRVRISAPVTLGLMRVVPALPALFARYGALQVDLRLEDRNADLAAEGIDLAVRAGTALPDEADLFAAPLWTFARRVVASPVYLARRSVPEDPSALRGMDLLGHVNAVGAVARWRLTREGDAPVDLEPAGPLQSNALLALRDAALAGLGVALLPEWLVADAVSTGRLRVLVPDWCAPKTRVWAVYRRERRNSARVRAVIEHLQGGLGAVA
jgi:DNA-binding transcriptional LysR family regulator